MARKALTTEETARNGVKFVNLTLAQIEREITDSGRLTFDREVKAKGTQTMVRIVIRVRAPHLEQWAISVVLVGNGRIDGIDWEAVVKDHRRKTAQLLRLAQARLETARRGYPQGMLATFQARTNGPQFHC